MFVTFDTLPDEARIWVYQSHRALTKTEQDIVLKTGQQFLDQWATHGQTLIGSIKVIEGYFVVIAVDDRQLPSGCSIDASVALMRDLGSKLKVDFFGRTNVPLWVDQSVQVVPMQDLKEQIKRGIVSDDTLLFNTLIQDKGGLASWIVSIKNSWLARYLPQPQHK
jgi:hypothetical protein